MQRICVYCGSSPGNRPVYAAAARRLGAQLAERGWGLVYGGASVGIMGVLADAVLAGGGEVHGVIPEVLKRKEVMHTGLTRLHLTDSMHQRKALMNDLADGFIALPGGFGTLEELFEVITWAQLGIHAKPIGLLNVDAYFDPLLTFLERSVVAGFVRRSHLQRLWVSERPEQLLDWFAERQPPAGKQWLDKTQI